MFGAKVLGGFSTELRCRSFQKGERTVANTSGNKLDGKGDAMCCPYDMEETLMS